MASLTLAEYYSGSLVERICYAANENVDLFSRKSSGAATSAPSRGEEGLSPVQRLKLLDICAIFDKQRTMGSAHAVSQFRFSLHFPLVPN
jgi:hypothetical protein